MNDDPAKIRVAPIMVIVFFYINFVIYLRQLCYLNIIRLFKVNCTGPIGFI